MKNFLADSILPGLAGLFIALPAAGQHASHDIRAASHVEVRPPALPVDQNDFVHVRTDVARQIVEYVVGPVSLNAAGDHLRLPIQMADFPTDGWIHGFEAEICDSIGNRLPMELLHHVFVVDPDERELFFPIARRIMAAGRETATQRLPGLVGYPVDRGARLMVAVMFANPTGRDYADVHLVVRFFVTEPVDGLVDPLEVFPFYLDVMGPTGTKDFEVPPGESVIAWEGSPAVESRILAIGGHVHDYATRLRLIDVTGGRILWDVEPDRTPDGHVTGVPSDKFLWTLGKKIRPDHVYRIEVEYFNPLDAPAPHGGMGAIGGVVWVDGDVTWPEFDRTDETYVEDLARTLTAHEHMDSHDHGG